MATLREAAWRGDVEMLRKGLRAGIRPDVTDDYGRTPLHYLCGPLHPQASSNTTAADDRRAACFKLLRDAGANLEATNSSSWTPLHCAVSIGSVGLVSLLVQSGVNVDAATTGGTTALHFAVRMGPNNCLEVLLAAGASLNLREGHGLTAFSLALLSRTNRWMWPLFLRAGAEIPTDNTDRYIVRVRNAGGFKKYEQAHLARITSILETPLLPPELVRKVLEYWLHAGYY
jgi:ankyrin repeat protein